MSYDAHCLPKCDPQRTWSQTVADEERETAQGIACHLREWSMMMGGSVARVQNRFDIFIVSKV